MTGVAQPFRASLVEPKRRTPNHERRTSRFVYQRIRDTICSTRAVFVPVNPVTS
jgi:hypothetical protein